MSCLLTLGRFEPCKDGVGGIKEIYFANFGMGVVTDPATEEVTDINDGEEVPAAITLYKWDVKGASNLEETVNSSRETGTTFWSQVLNATFKRLDATTRKEIKLMAYGRPQVIIVDYNDNAILLGERLGMEMTGGTIVTGTAMGDLSGYTIVLTGQEREPSKFLQGAEEGDPFAGMTTPPTIVDGTTP